MTVAHLVRQSQILAETTSGWENVSNSSGISIALVGLMIVFVGLILISTFISQLPKIAKFLERWFPVTEHHGSSPPSVSNTASNSAEETAAAIGFALHHHNK